MITDFLLLFAGLLIGYGLGYLKYRAARKAARAERIRVIKEYVKKRVANKVLNHTVVSAMMYYKEFSPEMFTDIHLLDVLLIVNELKEELDKGAANVNT